MTNWTPSGVPYVWLLLSTLPALSYGNSGHQRTEILLKRGSNMLVTCGVVKPEEKHTKGWGTLTINATSMFSTNLQTVPFKFVYTIPSSRGGGGGAVA